MQTSLGVLVLLAVLIAIGYARSRPTGYRIMGRHRILVALVAVAVLTPALSLRAIAMSAPDVTMLERVARFLLLAGIGAAPLAVFLFASWVLGRLRVER